MQGKPINSEDLYFYETVERKMTPFFDRLGSLKEKKDQLTTNYPPVEDQSEAGGFIGWVFIGIIILILLLSSCGSKVYPTYSKYQEYRKQSPECPAGQTIKQKSRKLKFYRLSHWK